MANLKYEIVEHDGGWAYRVDGSFSETFPTHAQALEAAERAAAEQRISDKTVGIVYQDKTGEIHEELDRGDDRPGTSVVDKS